MYILKAKTYKGYVLKLDSEENEEELTFYI